MKLGRSEDALADASKCVELDPTMLRAGFGKVLICRSWNNIRKPYRLSWKPRSSSPRTKISSVASSFASSMPGGDANFHPEKQALGETHPSTLTSLSNYALDLHKLRKFEEVAKLDKECREL